MAGGGVVRARGAGGWCRVLLALAWLLATLLMSLGTPAPAAAAAFVVTAGADTADGTCDGAHCSLREAITAAEANPDADTITFAPGVIDIVLDSALPTIRRSLTIQGSGVGGVTIRRNDAGGTPNFLLLDLTNGTTPAPVPPVTVTLEGLTLQNGRATGGASAANLYNFGIALTVRDSVIAGGQVTGGGNGGGYYQARPEANYQPTSAALINTTIRNNTVTGGNGGGVYLGGGTLTLTNTTIRDNRTTDGGNGAGVYLAGGTLTMTNSTVHDNKVTDANGGGFYVAGGTLNTSGSTVRDNFSDEGIGNGGGGGGGFYIAGGAVTLTNTTVSGNDANSIYTGGGGLYAAGGTLNLISSTVSGNSASRNPGGGLMTLLGATTTLFGSIVAGNTADEGNHDCVGTVTSLGYNVVGSGTGCPSGGTGDLAHTGALAALLNPTLAYNGGPTQTHALPFGSPAIDRVPAVQCSPAGGVDQRGVVRPQPTGGACDSGAFELAYHPLTVVVAGGLGVGLTPPGGGGGPFGYLPGTVVTLTPVAGAGQTFTGWVVDGVVKGWAPSLSLTMDAAHTVQATFAPTKTFADTGSNLPEYEAVVALATRGYILGLSAQEYGPAQGVQRAQMAALISRATPAGPDTPPKTAACVVPNSWDCEDWGNSFQDRGGLIESLWRNAGTLQHYKVAFGYDGPACAARNVPSPCYAPGAPVTHAETIAFITRAMQAKGYWQPQPNAPLPDPSVPGVLATEAKTYAYYTGSLLAPPPGTGWNDGATRGWFARALWQALNSYWGTDGNLADGRPAGGMVP